MKTCTRCGERHDHKHSYCYPCHLAYNREWRQRNPERSRANQQRWRTASSGARLEVQQRYRAEHPEKRRAHRAVYKAVRRGTLIRPEKCDICGEVCKPQAHHRDYAKRFEVDWLCHRCHRHIHADLLIVGGEE